MTFSALLWFTSVPDHLTKEQMLFIHTYMKKSLKSFKDLYFRQLFLSSRSRTCCSFRLLSPHASISWALLASSWSLAAIVPPCSHGTDASSFVFILSTRNQREAAHCYLPHRCWICFPPQPLCSPHLKIRMQAGPGRIHLRLKASHQISQQLVALIKHICKLVSHVAHLGTTNGTTNTFLFVMGSEPHHTCTDFSFFQPFFYCSKVPDGNEHDVLVLYRVPHPHPDSDLNWTHSAYHNTN